MRRRFGVRLSHHCLRRRRLPYCQIATSIARNALKKEHRRPRRYSSRRPNVPTCEHPSAKPQWSARLRRADHAHPKFQSKTFGEPASEFGAGTARNSLAYSQPDTPQQQVAGSPGASLTLGPSETNWQAVPDSGMLLACVRVWTIPSQWRKRSLRGGGYSTVLYWQRLRV